MVKFKDIWRVMGARAAMIISTIVLSLFIAATLIVTQVSFLYQTVNSVLGGERRVINSEGDASRYELYTSDYESKDATLEAANELNEKIEEEGIVLLKNDDAVLPLAGGANVTVLGKNSVNLVYGGSGSSASMSSEDTPTIYSSLEEAGFHYNPTMKAFYESSASGSGRGSNPDMGAILYGLSTGETPVSSYTTAVRDSYSSYKDAAIVVISRISGEGYDLPRTMKKDAAGTAPVEGARSMEDHYLQLDQNETDLLAQACENFDTVIVIINSSAPMELGFLEDDTHYAYQENIKAALWIGNPGETGINALGRILSGEATPSGHLVDTCARNFKNDPTWNNFGNNLVENGNRYMVNGEEQSAYYVDYEEGIYVGYRYYETRGYTEGEEWYEENVVYPLGYGLSYTTFSWELVEAPAEILDIRADSSFTFRIMVTNTGNYAGKDVVQLYTNAPYTKGGIEKPYVVLSDFAKTDLLQPGETQTVEVTVDAYDFASYDYNDANKNGFQGYELDAGKYYFKIMKNAHEASEISDIEAEAADGGIQFGTDTATGSAVENQFDDVSGHIASYLSRADWQGTWPAIPTEEDRTVTAEFISSLAYTGEDSAEDPWYTDEMPVQASEELTGDAATVKLYDLTGKDYDDVLWEELLDELTVTQMIKLIGIGNYQTVAIDNISKPKTTEPDGPEGFTAFMGDPSVYDTCTYCGECVMAAAWNKELAYAMGRMVGNEGLWGNVKGDGVPYSGWYAPAVNIHRSQFSGRNWEYYSEDGVLSGILASEVIKGASEKGVYTYVKHFAVNDQETNRDSNGILVWLNEQSLREIYLKPFEMAVKEGGTTAVMSSFNRIGTVWAGGSYELLTEVLRKEWGFSGMVVTDYNLSSYMNTDQMIRTGGDLALSQSKFPSPSDHSATHIAALRRAAKNILYTVANSNAMNYIGEGITFSYAMPYWVMALIALDAFLAICMGIWNFLAIQRAIKKTKN